MSSTSSPSKQSLSRQSKKSNHSSLVCIEYPAIVKNVDKMLNTLGGLDQLSQSYRTSMPRLELRFRPRDPFSHAAFGDRAPANSLLVKTRVIRRTYSDGRTELHYDTKPLGIIETVYKFKSLCDFQYLPMQRTNFKSTLLTEAKIMANIGSLNCAQSNNEGEENVATQATSSGSHSSAADIKQSRITSEKESIRTVKDEHFVDRILQQQKESPFNESPEYRAILNEILCDKVFDQSSTSSFNENAPLFIMPISFSRFDSPSYYFYRNDPKHRDKAIADEIERQNRLSIIGRNRKSRSLLAFLINWNDPIPETPDPHLQSQIEAKMNEKGFSAKELSDHRQTKLIRSSVPAAFHVDPDLMEQLRKCFEERPIWSRNALIFRLGCLRQDIRHLLTSCAFYYNNGPFRGMWVRFGYDPKKHPGSKVYQTLDFRLKAVYAKEMKANSSGKVYNRSEMAKKHVSMKKFANDKKPRVSLIHKESFGGSSDAVSVSTSTAMHGTEQVETSSITSTTATTNPKDENDLLSTFLFEPGLIPPYRQLFYQLQDIRVEEVQTIIHSNDGEETVCDEKEGWLMPGSLEKIRLIMSSVVKQTLDDRKKEERKRMDSGSDECQEAWVDEEEEEEEEDDEVVNEDMYYEFEQADETLDYE